MPLAIDTLKVSHKLQSAGMPRKQADAVVEVLTEAVEDRAGKDAVKEAVETLGMAMERRFASVDKQFASVNGQLSDLRGYVDKQFVSVNGQFASVNGQFASVDQQFASVNGQLSDLRDLLAKLLEGQAILHQNDMELKRRLDERKP